MSIPGNVGASFWWRNALPHTNQLGSGKRRWESGEPLQRIPNRSYIFNLLKLKRPLLEHQILDGITQKNAGYQWDNKNQMYIR